MTVDGIAEAFAERGVTHLCGAPIVVYTPKRGPLREGEQLFACGGVAKPSQWRGVVRCFCYGVFTSDNGVDVVLIS